MGSKKQILKLSKPDGSSKFLSEKDEKMGPIYLDVSLKGLYEAWNESFVAEVSGFPVESVD